MIIIINGTSSTGKTTVSQALQQRFGSGWLLFSTDNFLSMLGEKFENLHPDNPEISVPNDVVYAKKHSDGTYEIVPGKLCNQLYDTIPIVLSQIYSSPFKFLCRCILVLPYARRKNYAYAGFPKRLLTGFLKSFEYS